MTKKEMFAEIINLAEGKPTTATPVEIIEFASHEIELLEKKATTPRKPTANQIENESLAAEIVAYLTEVDTLKSIKELQEEVPSLSTLSAPSSSLRSTACSIFISSEVLPDGSASSAARIPYAILALFQASSTCLRSS